MVGETSEASAVVRVVDTAAAATTMLRQKGVVEVRVEVEVVVKVVVVKEEVVVAVAVVEVVVVVVVAIVVSTSAATTVLHGKKGESFLCGGHFFSLGGHSSTASGVGFEKCHFAENNSRDEGQ